MPLVDRGDGRLERGPCPGASTVIGWFGSEQMALTYAAVLGLYWRQPLRRALSRLTLSFKPAPASARQPALSRRRVARLLQTMPSWSFGISGLAAVLFWWLALTQPDGQLHVHFLDIGQGDGIFIQTPSGRQLLIDGGQDSQQLFAQLGAGHAPSGTATSTRAFVTHPDADHIAAQIDLPQRFRVGARHHQRQHARPRTHEALARRAQRQQRAGDWTATGRLAGPGRTASRCGRCGRRRKRDLHGWEEDDKNERSLVLRLGLRATSHSS